LNGHGTHVAGIIAGAHSGVAPQARIVPIRVLNTAGKGLIEDLLKGITYAVGRGARILKLSLGGLDLHDLARPQYEKVVAHARKLGVLLVVAAGNDHLNNDKAPVFPANTWDDNVVTVCSVDAHDQLSTFSNYGRLRVHLCAP